ncbi:MAG: response regulator [Caulobacteraceae bacterium]|nr:response regulator [Caulobacter sp.]
MTHARERAARVAVLEDQPFFSQLLATILTSAGYDAVVLREGPALLQAVARRPPDLVVLDIDMPGMDGLEVLERLRRRYDREALPIMMASARGEHSYPLRAKALGADLFLKKPYSIAQLIERVEALLSHSRAATAEVFL